MPSLSKKISVKPPLLAFSPLNLHISENMAPISDNFLKQRTMAKRFIQCSKCSIKIEVPLESQTIYCSRCDTYILVFNTASQSNIGCARGSRSISGGSLQISKKISSSGGSQPRSNKRALLCGVSYKGHKDELRGTVNDVRKMEEFLTQRFNFPEQSIRTLTEEEPKPENIPTKKNIENALKWLVQDCQRGDSLVFYFSGHGFRQADCVGDENDGYDETLCPVDYAKEGMILDNDINSTIVRPLPVGVKLHAIIDTCHSGTILDLHYIYDRKLSKWKEDIPPSGRPPKGTDGGLAICFSACGDSQWSSETSIFSEKGASIFAQKDKYGVMTTLFIQAIENCRNITYAQILDSINDEIREVNTQRGYFKLPILRRLFSNCNEFLQEPQLSASLEFNTNVVFNL